MHTRFLITGAGGWVGRVAALMLHAECPVLIARTERSVTVGGIDRSIESMAVLERLHADRPTILVHAGFPTQDKVEELGESAYTAEVSALRHQIAEAVRRTGPLDVVYISSGAAALATRGDGLPARTLAYGRAKLDDEDSFLEAVAARGGRLCVVRAYALSGPYMTKPQTYALGNMILQAARGGAIEVKASRPVRRSYMAIDDMLRIAIHAVGELQRGETITFDTAGEIVEVGELASRVLRVLGCDPSAVSRPTYDPMAPADDYLGDPVLVNELAERASVTLASLDEQIAVTAAWLREEYGV